MAESLSARIRRFRQWQQQPHQVKPLSTESHECATCGTRFEGNFCPRCGQSAAIGRYSFRRALLLFLDVWGLGNRGMFRSLRDLLLRPGYMIRDYLGGMQMAYFPPFKLLFLLMALNLLVASGLNLRGTNRISESLEMMTISGVGRDVAEGAESEAQRQAAAEFNRGVGIATDWIRGHMTIVMLLLMLLFSGPLYLFFRRCPRVPDLRFSEFFVAIVYTTDMLTLYGTAYGFLSLPVAGEPLLYVLAIVPLHQLSGYAYWRVVLKSLAALAIFAVLYMVVIFSVTFLWSILFGNPFAAA